MIKKIFTVAAVTSLALTACKKENAALRIDDAAARQAEMAHANSGKLAEAKFESLEHIVVISGHKNHIKVCNT